MRAALRPDVEAVGDAARAARACSPALSSTTSSPTVIDTLPSSYVEALASSLSMWSGTPMEGGPGAVEQRVAAARVGRRGLDRHEAAEEPARLALGGGVGRGGR